MPCIPPLRICPKILFHRVKKISQIPTEDRQCAICLHPYGEPNPDERDAKYFCNILPMREWEPRTETQRNLRMKFFGFGKDFQTHPVRLTGCGHHFCAPCAKQYFFGGDVKEVPCPLCRRVCDLRGVPGVKKSEIGRLRERLAGLTVRDMVKDEPRYHPDAIMNLRAIDQRVEHHLVNIFAIVFTRVGVPLYESGAEGHKLYAMLQDSADPEALHGMRASDKVGRNIVDIWDCGFPPLHWVYERVVLWQAEQPYADPEDVYEGLDECWNVELARHYDLKVGIAMNLVFRYFVRWGFLAGRIWHLRNIQSKG